MGPVPRASASFLLILLAPIQGCGAGEDLVAPTSAVLEVVTAVVNPPTDVEAYTILVDGVRHSVGFTDTIALPGLSAATHEVQVADLPQGCATEGTNPRFVALAPNATVSLLIQVICPAPDLPAELEVSIATRGSALDADGYSLLVDEESGRAVGVNEVLTLTDLAPGIHYLRLADVASNCEVHDSNPRAIDVPRTLETGFAVTCVPPIAGEIAYDSGRGDTDDSDFEFNADIYLRDVNGTSPRNLTNTPSEDEREPVWSPDGLQILFSTLDGPDRFLMNADGSDRRALADVPPSASSLKWSPDGRHLLFVYASTDFELALASYDLGTNQVQVLARQAGFRFFDGYCWSPDGSRVAYGTSDFVTTPSTSAMYTVSPEGGTPVPLTTVSDRDQVVQAWSPDGATIAFLRSDTDGRNDIYLVPADGSGPPINLTTRPGSYREVTWSPDGQMLAFNHDGLFTITRTGSSRQLTTKRAEYVSWSKDGSRLLFVESLELYLINFDGTGRRTITADGELNSGAAWRP